MSKNNEAPSKLIDLLQKPASEKQSEENQFHVEQKKLQFQSDLSATKQSLSSKKRERKELLVSDSLSAEKLSMLDDEIDSLEKGIERIQKYINELF